jgi:hypothetical protein
VNPDPNSVSIRLEIQVPTGSDRAGVRMAGVRTAGVGQQQDGQDFERFITTEPDNGDTWPVLPDNAGLGSICAKVVYGAPMTAVRAWVYPAAHYPVLPTFPWTHPLAPGAVPGVSTDGGFTWTWKYPVPSMVPGAAHLPAATGGAPNYLGIWYRRLGSTLFAFDDSPFFYGITDPVPCGSGSGSTSGMMVMMEGGTPEALLISVSDGPYAGRHYAKRRPDRREWIAELGRDSWVITPGPAGALVIRAGRRAVTGKVSCSPPFSATFPGEAFGSKGDVVVTAR